MQESHTPTCQELIGKHQQSGVSFEYFHNLRPEGKRLIKSWFRRASQMRTRPEFNAFECFIFTWISFNSWGAVVTEEDSDAAMIKELMIDGTMNEKFNKLINNNSSITKKSVSELSEIWPIYKSQEIRRKGKFSYGNRKQQIEHYHDIGIDNFEPKCYWRHVENNEGIPQDWPHILTTIYRVRCNLFHGEKSIISENDEDIVRRSLNVLFHFIDESELFKETTKQKGSHNIVGPIYHMKLGPSILNRAAQHCYKGKQDFKNPDGFSHLPYFLLCRSIELSIKSRHLKKYQPGSEGLIKLKDDYGHKLIKAYDTLEPKEKILSKEERDLLEVADEIYHTKGFEYFNPEDTLQAYNNFPDLRVLDVIAKKLLDNFSEK